MNPVADLLVGLEARQRVPTPSGAFSRES